MNGTPVRAHWEPMLVGYYGSSFGCYSGQLAQVRRIQALRDGKVCDYLSSITHLIAKKLI